MVIVWGEVKSSYFSLPLSPFTALELAGDLGRH